MNTQPQPEEPGELVSEEPVPSFHPLNTTALVVGVILVGLSGLWWSTERDLLTGDDLVYVLPTLLIVAGSIGVLAFVLRDRRP